MKPIVQTIGKEEPIIQLGSFGVIASRIMFHSIYLSDIIKGNVFSFPKEYDVEFLQSLGELFAQKYIEENKVESLRKKKVL